jgi:hypothetical protein
VPDVRPGFQPDKPPRSRSVKRTYVIVVILAVLLVVVALALRGDAGESLNSWFRSLHGQ